MTGLEKMVSQILEEADASAAVTISDAEKKAAEILREAGEKADKIRQQREEQSRAKVKSYEERTASAADMKKRTAVLAAKQELIGNVIADVYYIYVMNKKAKRLSVSLKEIKIPGTMIRDILVIGIPASITNLMQSIMIMITNHYLIAYGTDKVAAMGIALKANMISAFILVGFAFGGQPLVGYNYGARNKKRLKEILRFAYLFEAGLALVFTISISVFAPAIIKIFMNQSDIITNGAMMLRFQQLGMVFMAVTLVSTCVCQSVGSAAGAFALSISRQGVLYAISLMVLNAIFGYTGIIATQACADVLTAVIALAIIRKVLGGMKNEIQYDRG